MTSKLSIYSPISLTPSTCAGSPSTAIGYSLIDSVTRVLKDVTSVTTSSNPLNVPQVLHPGIIPGSTQPLYPLLQEPSISDIDSQPYPEATTLPCSLLEGVLSVCTAASTAVGPSSGTPPVSSKIGGVELITETTEFHGEDHTRSYNVPKTNAYPHTHTHSHHSQLEETSTSPTALLTMRVAVTKKEDKSPKMIYPYRELEDGYLTYRGYPISGNNHFKGNDWKIQIVSPSCCRPPEALPQFPQQECLFQQNGEYLGTRVGLDLTDEEVLNNSGEKWSHTNPPSSNYFFTAGYTKNSAIQLAKPFPESIYQSVVIASSVNN